MTKNPAPHVTDELNAETISAGNPAFSKNAPEDRGALKKTPDDSGLAKNMAEDRGALKKTPDDFCLAKNMTEDRGASKKTPDDFGLAKNMAEDRGALKKTPDDFGLAKNMAEDRGALKKTPDEPGLAKNTAKEKDPTLGRILAEYDAADAYSMKNARTYRRILAILSISSTLLVLAFLLYDEVSLYAMILVCGVMLLVLFATSRLAKRLRCHRNYLEYRLYAEGLRVQSFLRLAGSNVKAADLLPWSWQVNVPWTKQKLDEIMKDAEPQIFRSIPDTWIISQKEYHEAAFVRTSAKAKKNDRIMKTALILTILTYIAALVFEIFHGGLFSGVVRGAPLMIDTARTVLKILMGTLSCATLFAGNYYGKLSLDETMADHQRMISLYEHMAQRLSSEDSAEEILTDLAREALIENSNWYAYQCNNKPDISF